LSASAELLSAVAPVAATVASVMLMYRVTWWGRTALCQFCW